MDIVPSQKVVEDTKEKNKLPKTFNEYLIEELGKIRVKENENETAVGSYGK